MKPAVVSLGGALFSLALAAQSRGDMKPSARVEVRIATLANSESGGEPCEVVQAAIGGPLAFWSTLGEAGASGNAGFELRGSVSRCGVGAVPGGATAAPFLIQEISVYSGWDPGAMDPGPGGTVQLSLTFTSRQLTGFSQIGRAHV